MESTANLMIFCGIRRKFYKFHGKQQNAMANLETGVLHRLRDPACVNAMKQTCVIVILAHFTLFHFLTLDFSKQNGIG